MLATLRRLEGWQNPFFNLDRRSLEIFRIGICICTFFDLWYRLYDFEAFHCITGLLNDESLTVHGAWIHRILFYRGSVYFQSVVFFCHFITTILLLFCYKLNVTVILHFLFTISLHERNPYINGGGDRFFRNICFWLMLLPTYHYKTLIQHYNNVQLKSRAKSQSQIQIQTHDASLQNLHKSDSNYYDNCKVNKTQPNADTHTDVRLRSQTVTSHSTMAVSVEMEKEIQNDQNAITRDVKSKNNYRFVKYYNGLSGLGIMIQANIIYIFAVLLRYLEPYITWDWNVCTAIHISFSRFQITRPNTNILFYFAGMFPRQCFYICRIVTCVEIIVPLSLVFLTFLPLDTFTRLKCNNYKCVKNKNIFFQLRLVCMFMLAMLHFSFDMVFELQNFPKFLFTSLMPFIPTYVYDELWPNLVASRFKSDSINIIKRCWIKLSHSRLFGHLMTIYKRNSYNSFKSNNFNMYATSTNQLIALFFIVYNILNNLGDPGIELIPKWDKGRIGEALRINQNWCEYHGLTDYTSYHFMVANIDFEPSSNGNANAIAIGINSQNNNNRNNNKNNENNNFNANVVLNELLTSHYKHMQIYDGNEKYVERHANGRPISPAGIVSQNMKYEKFWHRVYKHKHTKVRESAYNYYCNLINNYYTKKNGGIEIDLRRYNRSEDGSVDKIVESQMIYIDKINSIEWCTYRSKIVNLWEQEGWQWIPKYTDDKVQCSYTYYCQ